MVFFFVLCFVLVWFGFKYKCTGNSTLFFMFVKKKNLQPFVNWLFGPHKLPNCSALYSIRNTHLEFMGFLHVTGHQTLTFNNFTNSSKFIIMKIQSKETNSLNIEYLSFRQWPIVSWKSLEFYWISVKFVITDPVICPYISQFLFLIPLFFSHFICNFYLLLFYAYCVVWTQYGVHMDCFIQLYVQITLCNLSHLIIFIIIICFRNNDVSKIFE